MTRQDIPLLEMRKMSVSFPTQSGERIEVLSEVSLNIWPSEVLGVVGESGSGKSMLTFASLGLLPKTGRASGEVRLRGEALHAQHKRRMSQVRGREIGLIVQEPTPSLNPVRRIGSQLAESARHARIPADQIKSASIRALDEVNLPAEVLGRYPGELSGGMNQRVAIAMVLLQNPGVLIADEPTTALDVTTQYEVMQLLEGLRVQHEMGMMLISHDLGVIKAMADRIAVMYRGHLVELGTTADIVSRPRHPYTQTLVASAPRLHPIEAAPLQDSGCPLLPGDPQLSDDHDHPPTLERDRRHVVWCWDAHHGHAR